MRAHAARSSTLWLGCVVATGCALEWRETGDAGMDAEIGLIDSGGTLGLEDAANPLAVAADGRSAQEVALGAQGSATDPRWQRWVGRYAARTIVHGIDGDLRPRSIDFSLVEIEPRGDHLVLEQRLCLLEGTWSHVQLDGGTLDTEEAIFRINYYESVSFVTEMLLEEKNFETKPIRYQVGFDPEPPRACVPGSVADSTQPWLSGECTCPSETGEVPASASDCRVTDPELDGQPGATVEARSNHGDVDFYVAQQVEIRYLVGFRTKDGLFASVEASESHAVFGCSAPELTEDCSFGAAMLCPPEYNGILFVPLPDDEDYDCNRVVRERDGLFPWPPSEFPDGCGAGR